MEIQRVGISRIKFLNVGFCAVNFWLKLFPVLHKISGDFSYEIRNRRRTISYMFDDLRITRLFLCKSKHSEHTALGLHKFLCLL